MSASLEAVAAKFRRAYLSYDEITAQLRAWADAYPALVRVRSLGQTLEGRDLWLATLGPDPDRDRPSVWIDGNMHASELCGSSVALAIAEDVLRIHLDPGAPLHALTEAMRGRIREVRFFILPRMCPDGAEAVLTTGRYVRSNPRDRRVDRTRPRWIAGDVDGDGVAMLMRREDPAGEFVTCDEVPGLLLPRRLEDAGPFYKVFPEGHIEHFDGVHIPDPYFLSDNDTDLNRNFPYSWRPEPEQAGAGSFPLSEPESRAVVEFVSQRPDIFAWLNLHTFGGVYIRPLGDQPDKKMDRDDLAIFRQIGAWGEALCGYPMVSGFEDFLYEPDKPLHGDLSDFGYHQRGAIAYVCELWDLFKQIGIARKHPFVDHYTTLTREELIALAKWDTTHNAGRATRPWRAFQHPQLGAVEIGGVDSRVGLSNPPYEMLGEVCRQQSAIFLRVAAMAPSVTVSETRVHALGDGVHRVSITVENVGYLPTYVLSSAKALAWNEPLVAEATGDGVTLATPHDGRRDVGHLVGWGRGLHGSDSALFFQRSRGSVSSNTVTWTVTGRGTLCVRIGGCRTGWIETTVKVG